MYTERLRELVGSECSDLPLDTFDHNTNTISEVEPVDATSYRLGSVLVVRSLEFMLDNFVLEFTSLPSITWIAITPFYTAGVVEIVQSDRASSPSTLVSCLRSGVCRLFHLPSYPRSSNSLFSYSRNRPVLASCLLPIWYLYTPVVLFNCGHYVVRSLVKNLISKYLNDREDKLESEAEYDQIFKTDYFNSPSMKSNQTVEECGFHQPSDWITLHSQRQETAMQNAFRRNYTDLVSQMYSCLVADVLLYPLETLAVRLCVQGTRTLVDNMDIGDLVVPIISNFEGFFDALNFALDSEHGLASLYAGFGSLVTQYTLHAFTLYGIRCLFEQLLYLYPPLPMYTSRNQSNSSNALQNEHSQLSNSNV